MEKEVIYGVSLSEEVTPVKARDAIIRCFLEAHREVLDEEMGCGENCNNEEVKSLEEFDVREMVKKYIGEVGGDFEDPTREDLIGVCEKLRDFSKDFRSESVINEHYCEIKKLLDKVD